MLTGEKLGAALEAAIKLKGVSKADVARHFDVKPPSVQGWIKSGRISKTHIEKLVSYFSDVVGPEHWGMGRMHFPALERAMREGADAEEQQFSRRTDPYIPAGASIVTYENPDELDPERYVWIDRYNVNLSAGCDVPPSSVAERFRVRG